MSTHHQPTKEEVAAKKEAADHAKEVKAEAAEVKAKHELVVSIKERIDAERRAHPHLTPPSEGTLLAMLESTGDGKTPAMDEIHLLLVQVRVFMEQVIREAEGNLKPKLEALRNFLF